MVDTYFDDDKSNPAGSNGFTMILGNGDFYNYAEVGYGNKIVVQSGGSFGGYVSDGGLLMMNPGAHILGTVDLYSGGKMFIWPDAGGSIYMNGYDPNSLTISGLTSGGTVSTVIDGFDGAAPSNSDQIQIFGVAASSVTGMSYPSRDQIRITLDNGTSFVLNIKNIASTGVYLATNTKNGYLVLEVCFLAGSMISTPDGDVEVENLSVGDLVNVFDWQTQTTRTSKITWAGKKDMAVHFGLPDDLAGYPVRVLKDAVAPGVPYKDLLVTGEHCLFFDGKFIPVRMLVNGRSVFYDRSLTHYTYYHIETESHSVIWANGMKTESYLNTGNRALFAQYGNLLTMVEGKVGTWEDHGAAPLTTSREQVEPVFRELERRAAAESIGEPEGLKPVLTDDHSFHLVAEDGVAIRKIREANGYHVFVIPPNITKVRMVSRISRPSDAIGAFVDDRRHLGVRVGEIQLFQMDDSRSLDAHLHEETLEGWDVREHTPCRWTNGNALLSLGERKPDSVAMLAVQILQAGPYLIENNETEDQQASCA